MLTQKSRAKQRQTEAANQERSGLFAKAKNLYAQACVIWGRVPDSQSNKDNCKSREKHCEAMAMQLDQDDDEELL